MYKFSFLDYIDNYSYPHLLEVERAADFKSRNELALFVGISRDTAKSWFARLESRRKRPNRQSWNLMLYELEARRQGFATLADLIKHSGNKPQNGTSGQVGLISMINDYNKRVRTSQN